MKIEGAIALVTGANRGLGRAYVEALLAAGARRVYAAARDPATIAEPRAIAVKLDVTSTGDIAAAAARCGDVSLLVNNAGAMLMAPSMAADAADAMRREMAVNVYGLLAMMQAFAPILARNGGGAIANVLSVVSWFASPANATYCASKHAAEALTDAARIELAAQGTHVAGIYAGFIDTDMAASLTVPKTPPLQVAARTLEGLRNRTDRILTDTRAEQVWRAMRADPARMDAEMRALWEKRSGER